MREEFSTERISTGAAPGGLQQARWVVGWRVCDEVCFVCVGSGSLGGEGERL